MPSPFRSAGFRWFVVAPCMFVVFLASFLFVTFHLVRAAAIPKRDQVVAELDASDPNWRTTALTAERNAKLPPPDQNAAELAYQAYKKLPKAHHDWEMKSPTAQWRGEVKNPHLPHASDIAGTRAQLRKVHEAVRLARDIRHVPSGGFLIQVSEPNPLNTLLPKHQNVRQVYSLLTFDAAVRAYDRDDTGALESCLAILAAARGFGDDPLFVSQLIRIAGVAICVGALERTLCWGVDFNDTTLVNLDKAFEREANEPRLLYGLRGERAMFYRLTVNIDSGELSVSELAMSGRAPFYERLQTAPYRVRLPEEQTVALQMFNRLIELAMLPPSRERTVAIDSIETEYDRLARGNGPIPRYILLRLLMPAVSKVLESDTRTVANLNAARVAVACERHRQKTGAYPEKLDELPKELLSEVPLDPFSDKPILYKKLDDGAVAYSVGADGVDDGAKKLDPKNEKGNDLGFRLWTLDHRRKPPAPKTHVSSPPTFGSNPFELFEPDDKPKPGASTAPPPLSPWVKEE